MAWVYIAELTLSAPAWVLPAALADCQESTSLDFSFYYWLQWIELSMCWKYWKAPTFWHISEEPAYCWLVCVQYRLAVFKLDSRCFFSRCTCVSFICNCTSDMQIRQPIQKKVQLKKSHFSVQLQAWFPCYFAVPTNHVRNCGCTSFLTNQFYWVTKDWLLDRSNKCLDIEKIAIIQVCPRWCFHVKIQRQQSNVDLNYLNICWRVFCQSIIWANFGCWLNFLFIAAV